VQTNRFPKGIPNRSGLAVAWALVVLVSCGSFWVGPAFAAPGAGSLRVRRLVIAGNQRTNESVVRRELGLGPGDPFDQARLDEGVQRLKNLHIFSAADAVVERTASGVDVQIVLRERWTLVPFFLFNSGGGTSYISLGVVDINVLGRGLRVAGRGELFGRVPGAELQLGDPHLVTGPWDARVAVAAEAGINRRVQSLYRREGELLGGFLNETRRIEGTIRAIRHEKASLSLGLALVAQQFSERFLSESRTLGNDSLGIEPVGSDRAVVAALSLRLGRRDFDSYLNRGASVRLSCDQARSLSGGAAPGGFVEPDFWSRCLAETLLYLVTPLQGNVAARLGVEATTATHLPRLISLGGFDRLRGFHDGQFRGRRAWYSNLELRMPSYRSLYFVLQHAAFLDAADAAGSLGELRAPWNAPPACVGLGVRIIFPQVFLANLRIDYAWGISREHGGGFSVGLGQFF
jgi:outer membrane protein assembly factor BamA